MQFNVAQLLKEQTGATRDYELDESIEGLDSGLEPLTNLTGNLRLLRIHSGILARGAFDVTLEVTCNRCLEPVSMQVQTRFEENFRPLTDVETGRFIPPQEFKGQEDDLTDAALLISDLHILDISEVVRQNIWLSLPMAPGCTYSDPQNCPNFTQRLEEMEKVHEDLNEEAAQRANIDPRWSALLALQEENDE